MAGAPYRAQRRQPSLGTAPDIAEIVPQEPKDDELEISAALSGSLFLSFGRYSKVLLQFLLHV